MLVAVFKYCFIVLSVCNDIYSLSYQLKNFLGVPCRTVWSYFSDDFPAILFQSIFSRQVKIHLAERISSGKKFQCKKFKTHMRETKRALKDQKWKMSLWMLKFSQLILEKYIETCNENADIDLNIKGLLHQEILSNSPIRKKLWR